jgi:hypothetical protein
MHNPIVFFTGINGFVALRQAQDDIEIEALFREEF